VQQHLSQILDIRIFFFVPERDRERERESERERETIEKGERGKEK
jgi:hypothetical protein